MESMAALNSFTTGMSLCMMSKTVPDWSSILILRHKRLADLRKHMDGNDLFFNTKQFKAIPILTY